MERKIVIGDAVETVAPIYRLGPDRGGWVGIVVGVYPGGYNVNFGEEHTSVIVLAHEVVAF